MYKIEYKPLIKNFEEFNKWCRYGNSHFNLSCSNICKPYKIVAQCCEYSEYFEYSQKGFNEAIQWLIEKRTLILKALGAAKQIESLQKRLDEKCDTCIDRDKKNTAKEILDFINEKVLQNKDFFATPYDHLEVLDFFKDKYGVEL